MTRPKTLFAMPADTHDRVFDQARRDAFAAVGDVLGRVDEFSSPASRELLGTAEVLVTGWGSPLLDSQALDAAPHLAAVLHAAGSVKHHLTGEVWSRGIAVTSAAAANAVPVAQYTLAMILLAGKRVLPIAERYRRDRADFEADAVFPGMGNVDKRVGIVGASHIGRHVVAMLQPHGFEILIHDPFLSASDAAELGARSVELDELMRDSDIVSLHAPSVPETHHMVDEGRIAAMRPGATLINTARGELVDQEALTRRLLRGDLYAILDVTTPWILDPAHPLYTLPNVLLTPHIAGSLGTELGALADSTLDELRRFAAGQPLAHPVLATALAITA